MARKYLTIIGIVILCAIIIASFLYLHKNQQFEAANPAFSIPHQSAIVLEVHQPEAFKEALFSSPEYQQDLLLFQNYRHLTELIHFVDSSKLLHSSIGQKLLSRPYHISFHTDTADNRQWLVSAPLKSRSEINEVQNALESNNARFQALKSKSGTIFHFKKQENWPFDGYLALNQTNIIVSPSPYLIDLSMNQTRNKQSLAFDPNYQNLQRSAVSSNAASLLINFKNLAAFSQGLFKAPVMEHLAEWTELDVDVRKDALYLNGFTRGRQDSLFVNIFKGIEPQKTEIFNILPASAKFMMSYSLQSKSHFNENLNTYIQQTSRHENFDPLSKKFTDRHKVPFDELFFSFIEGEGAFVYSYSEDQPVYEPLLVFSTTGQTQALEVLTQMMARTGQNTGPVEWSSLDDQTRFPVYRTPETSIIKAYWGALFPEVPATYFAFYRNYLVFANSISAINQLMYANLLHKTMGTHPYFHPFTENFSYRENFFMFAEMGHIMGLTGDHINREAINPTREQNKALGNFYGVGLQLSASSDLIYTSIHASHAPHRDKEPRTIWQSRLDSTITTKPALVDNHETGEKEILVQDHKHNLYLINHMGRILWKRALDGPILSEITQIDYYKNNKLQYLFNTPDKIYLLDRNGNHVARFPLNLPDKATNGLSVFDYDKDLEYRIFIALADKHVYLYDKTGNRITGWSVPQTEGHVTTPLQHFNNQGRDYLVFSDEYKNYILNRRGDPRVSPSIHFFRNPNSPFYLQGRNSDQPALVTTTTTGELVHIALPSGKTTLTQLFDGPSNHHFTLINGSSPQPEYLYVTKDQLLLFNHNGQEKVNISFEKPIHAMADIYQFSSSDIKIGVVEQSGGKIHLINKDGSHYNGFPLKGLSRFSIGFLKTSAYRFNLITGGEHNYLYNYRVE
ncbi:DUF3352 domain-containing protein [Geofilum rubicundum]|uniref:Uncharacterized protein n=1 Tax=Geofilum rubicundum JCM 15548 TaxID=1236989 RepID=A0A0E9LSP4_9BACT|nr:DUF3352 domain-containing protein [Geofilum rubicundum]GAO28279.1 hypothetical protein JCM15548_1353 [Geofilum rubicundum JCM 15548]